MLSHELEIAVCAYERGESTLTDLRRAAFDHLKPGQAERLFARLPVDAAGLIRWLAATDLERRQISVGNFTTEVTTAEADASHQNQRTGRKATPSPTQRTGRKATPSPTPLELDRWRAISMIRTLVYGRPTC